MTAACSPASTGEEPPETREAPVPDETPEEEIDDSPMATAYGGAPVPEDLEPVEPVEPVEPPTE